MRAVASRGFCDGGIPSSFRCARAASASVARTCTAARVRKPLAGHDLMHGDGLSVRQAQRVMAEQYGFRRAIGIIARDLRNFECPLCSHMNRAV
jgi:hypothetical protein